MGWQKYLLTLWLLCVTTQAGELTFEGLWGDWTSPVMAPDNHYLCGGQMQFEPNQGRGDDTAANGISFIFCSKDNWQKQWENWYKGTWGFWKQRVFCPKGSFVNGMQVRFEKSQGDGDDTALNGLKLNCKFERGGQESQVLVYNGIWGDWSNWIKTDGSKLEYVNGYKVRYEKYQGPGDDSALNGITLFTKQIPRKISALYFTYTQLNQLPASRPLILQTQIMNNNNKVPSKSTFTIRKQVPSSETWQNTDKYLSGIEIPHEISLIIPALSDSNQQIFKSEKVRSFAFDKANTAPKLIDESVEKTCPPCKTCTYKIIVKQYNLKVPYSVSIIFDSGEVVNKNGVYAGTTYSKAFVEKSEVDIPNCSKHHKHLYHPYQKFLE